MALKTFFAVLFLAMMFPGMGWARPATGNIVDVRVISDRGSEFVQYRTYPRVRREGRYFYMEAAKGEKYSIRVSNGSRKTIGVVIAVDGRNIVSGEKSYLSGRERMYIIGPHETHTFDGWRTGMNRTNRFYFTEQADSYAERAFSDASAMGTIAVAVYREKEERKIRPWDEALPMRKSAPGAAPRAPAENGFSHESGQKKSEQAGTGFGETTYSPSRVVRFEPERTPADRIVLKYEWRTELCRKGIVSCGPKNRMWPEGEGFAPIPEDFRG